TANRQILLLILRITHTGALIADIRQCLFELLALAPSHTPRPIPQALNHRVAPLVVLFEQRPQARELGLTVHTPRPPNAIPRLLEMGGRVIEIDNRHLGDPDEVRGAETKSEMVEEAPIFLGAIGQLDDLEVGAPRQNTLTFRFKLPTQ